MVFLLLMALTGGTFVAAPIRPVAADDLTDAIAHQKALEAQIASQKAKVAAITKQQKALGATLASTKASLGKVNADLAAVRGQVVQATVAVAQAQADVQALDTQVAKLDVELADLVDREARKTDELTARKALLADRIRQAYDTDRTSLLETFLSGETFTDVLAEVSYHLDFAQQDRDLAEQIVADQKVLAVLHQTVQTTRDQAEGLRGAATVQRELMQTQLASLAESQASLANTREGDEATARPPAGAVRQDLERQDQARRVDRREPEGGAGPPGPDRQADRRARQRRFDPVRLQRDPGLAAGRMVTQEFGCTGFPAEPRKGSCAHFHEGHRHRRPVVLADPGGRGTASSSSPDRTRTTQSRRPGSW